MNGSDREKVIDKIRKLLALSQSPNENEAASAAAKAQAMLAEHCLHMAEVESQGGAKVDANFTMDNALQTESVKWRRWIANAVAQMYFCSHFFSHKYQPRTSGVGYKRTDTHTFVGAAENIEVCKMMFTYLCATVVRLSLEGAKQQARDKSSYITSFRQACAARLHSRIKERIAAAKRGEVKTEAGTNLPALMNLYTDTHNKLQAYIAEKVGGTRHVKQRGSSNNVAGYMDGTKAGNSIGLDTQIGGRKPAGLIG